MAYEKPPCSFNQIDRAGKTFFNEKLSIEERAGAIDAIWNWRTAHSYPLNALHMTLRNRTLKVEKTAFTAQRLKGCPRSFASLVANLPCRCRRCRTSAGAGPLCPACRDYTPSCTRTRTARSDTNLIAREITSLNQRMTVIAAYTRCTGSPAKRVHYRGTS